MAILDNLQQHFCLPVYPAIEDSSSELYKFMRAIAGELEDFRLSLVEYKESLSVNTATGVALDLLGDSFNIARFKGEPASYYRKKFRGYTGIADSSYYGMLQILNQFTLLPVTIVELGNSEINIVLPTGATFPPEYLWAVGVQDTYGSAIGDDDEDTAGAIYASVNSVVLVPMTYFEHIVSQVKPVGIKTNIIEEGA